MKSATNIYCFLSEKAKDKLKNSLQENGLPYFYSSRKDMDTDIASFKHNYNLIALSAELMDERMISELEKKSIQGWDIKVALIYENGSPDVQMLNMILNTGLVKAVHSLSLENSKNISEHIVKLADDCATDFNPDEIINCKALIENLNVEELKNALSNIRMNLSKKNFLLKQFNQLNTKINSSVDIESIYLELTCNAKKLTECEIGFLIVAEQGLLSVCYGDDKVKLMNLEKSILENADIPFSKTIRDQVPFILNNCQSKNSLPGLPDIKNIASVPLSIGDEICGALCAANSHSGHLGNQDLDILSSLANIGGTAFKNSRIDNALAAASRELRDVYGSLNQTYKELQNHVVIVDQIQELSRKMQAHINLEVIVRELIGNVYHLLGCDYSLIMFQNPLEDKFQVYTNHAQLQEFFSQETKIKAFFQAYFKECLENNIPVLDNSPQANLIQKFASFGMVLTNIVAVPLIETNNTVGLLMGMNKKSFGGFSPTDRHLLMALKEAVITIMMNSRLFIDLKSLFRKSIEVMANAIEARDSYTRGHTERVTAYTIKIAEQMGWDGARIEKVFIGTLLHDVGKIGIPDRILNKPSRLTEEEYEVMKSHVTLGVKIVKDIKQLDEELEVIKYHHERFDGRGYPHGLSGEDIPLCGRIVAVADSFDAMTSTRPYRSSLSIEQAVAELKKHSGTQFDSNVVDHFIMLLQNGLLDHIIYDQDNIQTAEKIISS